MKTYFLIVSLLFNLSAFPQSFTVSSLTFNIPVNELIQKKNYDWFHENDSLSSDSYYLNDINLKHDIEKAISKQLQNLGCTATTEEPQILIRYTVLAAPSRLYGIHQNKNFALSTNTLEAYNVEPGTLIISFLDPASQQILWQGFASGVIDSQAPIKNTALVNEAVRLVSQEYAYLVNNNSAQ
jgi:hypothetical protein